jgi:hypothetical protein
VRCPLLSELNSLGVQSGIRPRTLIARLALVWIPAFCLLAVTGCARALTGTYTDEQKIVSLQFKDGKAYMGSFLGNMSELDYQVKGNDLVIKAPQGNMVLRIQDDGSLAGFGLGTTLRKIK